MSSKGTLLRKILSLLHEDYIVAFIKENGCLDEEHKKLESAITLFKSDSSNLDNLGELYGFVHTAYLEAQNFPDQADAAGEEVDDGDQRVLDSLQELDDLMTKFIKLVDPSAT